MMRRLASVLALVLLPGLALLSPLSAGPAAAQPPPGPCDPGWVAPTPTAVTVSQVPIVVSSTSADYFVLYVSHGRGNNQTVDIPVAVTKGLDGTTTLSDNLSPLTADRYRVEKYQIANPGDLDGDCVDDITELDDLGAYNPINSAQKIAIADGSVAIGSRTMFETLSWVGQASRIRGDAHLLGAEYIKFWIVDPLADTPAIYFQNTNTTRYHPVFARKLGFSGDEITQGTKGEIVYHPNLVAPDGTPGVYAFRFTIFDNYGFSAVNQTNELLAAAMPVLSNNLVYYPLLANHVSLYEQDKALFDSSRINVVLEQDVAPDTEYVALNQGEGYGLLRVIGQDERPGPQDIAIFETLPNDLPRVAGTITTVPQTPLAHINLRAIQSGLPNAYIRDALSDDAISSLIDSHVYFAVASDGYAIRAATKAEVEAHYDAQRPTATQTLTRDLAVTEIKALKDVNFADWTAFGVKAANMAELSKLGLPAGTVPTGYAVPFYFYDKFMKQATLSEETILGKKKAPDEEKLTLPAGTTLAAAVTAMLAHPYFQTDYDIQEEMLDDLRKAIKKAQSPAWIITALEQLHAEYPAGQSLRYRSSTNNEDLPSFSGAGLYSSKTQDPDETTDEGIDKSIKAVWASLWNFRAFLERDFHRVDHTTVAMGVLVHPNFSDELVNGVALSYDSVSYVDDMYYVNSQVGEDLVTNPEAYSQPEQLLLNSAGEPTVISRSNLAASDQLLMTDAQMAQLRSNLKTIHDHFATLYGAKTGEDFAIEIEFKITAANQLAIKQARPWIFAEPLDLGPAVTVEFAATTVTEGDGLDLVVTRSGLVLSDALLVDLEWSETGQMLTKPRPPLLVQILRGQKTATVTVNTSDDDQVEPDSTVTVSIGASSAYRIGSPASASATVEDNDSKSGTPEVTITAGAGITEGGSATFTLAANPRPKTSLDVTVDVTQSGDVATTGSQTVTIPAAGSATLTVATTDDGVDETDGSVTATLVGGTGYTISGTQGAATVAVADDDGAPVVQSDTTVLENEIQKRVDLTAGNGDVHSNNIWRRALAAVRGENPPDGLPELTASHAQRLSDNHRSGGRAELADLWQDVADAINGAYQTPPPSTPEVTIAAGADVTEGQGAAFTITASPAPSSALDVTVDVALAGDFGVTAGSRTVTIPAAGSATLTITTADDGADEPDGSVTVALASGTGYTVGTAGSATVAVADDDLPALSIAAGGDIAEGGSATFTISASPAPHQALSVAVTVSDSGDFASSGQAGSRTVTVPVSGSVSFSVGTEDDGADEANGTIAATLQVGSRLYAIATATASVAVSDDDAAPVTETEADTSALEAEIQARIDLTAQKNDHHSNRIWRGALAAVRGEQPRGDVREVNAAFAQRLSDNHGAKGRAELSGLWQEIADALNGVLPLQQQQRDDPPPPPDPEITITGGADVSEGSDAVFTLSATPAPTSPLTVNLSVSQQGDFASSLPATVTLTGGSATLRIGTVNDSTDESNGSITVALGSGAGYTVGASSAATIAVSDNDDAPPPPADPEITITGGADVSEGSDAVFTLSATPAPTSPLTVNLSVSQQGDFASSLPATVTLTGGSATLRIGTVDDGADEPDGSITVALASGSGYTLGASSAATVAVADDDDAPPPPQQQDSSSKADLIARVTALVDEYEARSDESSNHFLVSWRAEETLRALKGESSMASNPALAPYHFRAAIAAAQAVGNDDAAALFAEARDFLGVREL